jgi:hypothetical protein
VAVVVAGCLLPAVSPLPVACCLLPAVSPLPVAGCLLFDILRKRVSARTPKMALLGLRIVDFDA